MAFEVETGSGSATANSYLSVADADTYHADHGNSTDWSGASEATKQEALRLATQYLDAKYGSRWRGTKSDGDQALDWPRSYAYDDNDYAYDADAIPQKLADAAAELALRVVEGDTLLDDITNPGTIKREKKKLTVLEKEIEYQGGKSQVKAYPLVEGLLKSLIVNAGLERG